jgi:hypothetical protein
MGYCASCVTCLANNKHIRFKLRLLLWLHYLTNQIICFHTFGVAHTEPYQDIVSCLLFVIFAILPTLDYSAYYAAGYSWECSTRNPQFVTLFFRNFAVSRNKNKYKNSICFTLNTSWGLTMAFYIQIFICAVDYAIMQGSLCNGECYSSSNSSFGHKSSIYSMLNSLRSRIFWRDEKLIKHSIQPLVRMSQKRKEVRTAHQFGSFSQLEISNSQDLKQFISMVNL